MRAGSTVKVDYGYNRIPTLVLIDLNGKISFYGHPKLRDVEKDIDTLLRGEPLSGEGTANHDIEDEEADLYLDRDIEQATTEINRFEEALKTFPQTDDLKNIAKDLDKDTLTVLRSSRYSTK
jgi:hypothetical protein